MVQVSSLFRGYVVLNKEMKIKKNPSKGDNSIASSGLSWCLNHEYSSFCLLTFASMAK